MSELKAQRKWVIIPADADCPVPQVYPTAVGGIQYEDIQLGHAHGVCDCRPCLLDARYAGERAVLIHHVLVDGKPVNCTEPGSHTCSLKV